MKLPTLSPLDIPINLNLSELSQVSQPSKEDSIESCVSKIEEAKKKALNDAKCVLRPDEYEQFEPLLSNSVKRIVHVLKEMKTNGHSPEAISRVATLCVSNIDASSSEFLKRKESYELQKKQTLEKVGRVKSKIDHLPNSETFSDFSLAEPSDDNFFDFIMKSEFPESSCLTPEPNIQGRISSKASTAADPLENLRRFQYEENAALAHLTASALNGISGAVGKSLETAARLTCSSQIDPVTREACHQIIDNLTNSPESTDGQRERHSPSAVFLERELSIPREVTEQYERDAATIGGHLVAGVGGAGLGQVVRVVAKPTVSRVVTSATTHTARDVLLNDASKKISIHTSGKAGSSITSGSEFTTTKIKMKMKAHLQRIVAENSILQNRLSHHPSINMPTSFPKGVRQFLSQHEKHAFNVKGVVKGDLMYKKSDDSIMFFLKTTDLTKASGVSSGERMKHILEATFKAAQEKGCKRLFLAWDPTLSPVASTLTTEQLEMIVGRGTLAKGIYEKPLPILEFSLKR